MMTPTTPHKVMDPVTPHKMKKRPALDSEDDDEPSRIVVKKAPKKKLATLVQPSDKRAWIHEKAAESVIPTEENAKVFPDRVFRGLDPLILHMCTPCKKFNAARETREIADGMIELPLALCTVCRAHLIAQKNLKFYQHDCPSLKKELNL